MGRILRKVVYGKLMVSHPSRSVPFAKNGVFCYSVCHLLCVESNTTMLHVVRNSFQKSSKTVFKTSLPRNSFQKASKIIF